MMLSVQTNEKPQTKEFDALEMVSSQLKIDDQSHVENYELNSQEISKQSNNTEHAHLNNIRAQKILKPSTNEQQDETIFHSQQAQSSTLQVSNALYLKEESFKVQLLRVITHVKLLLKKNFQVNQRHRYLFAFHYITPLIVFLMLMFWQGIANQATHFLVLEPNIIPNPQIPQCFSPEYVESQDSNDLGIPTSKSKGCISVGYHVIGDNQLWIDQVMKYVAHRNNLIFGKDVQLLSTGSPKKFQKYVNKHLNRTQIGVIFCTTYYPLDSFGINIDIPCSIKNTDEDYIKQTPWYVDYFSYSQQDIERLKKSNTLTYTILYNYTLNYKTPYMTDPKTSVGKDDLVKALKVSLDNGIIEIVANNSPKQFLQVFDPSKSEQEQYLKIDFDKERMQITQQDFPKIPSRFSEGYDVFAGTGGFYLFIPIMISFILQINEILREKENKLRQGLTTIGVSHFSYISSWVIYSFLTIGLLEVIMVLLGIALNFEFFTRSPVLVSFSVLFSFGLSILSIGFLICSICNNVKVGYTTSYAFLLFSIVMELFMSIPAFIFYLYKKNPSWYIQTLLSTFSLYPAFHYSKLFHDIAQRTNKHFDVAAGRWIAGPGFEYEDIFIGFTGKFPYPPTEYETPTPFTSFIYLNLTTLLFFIIGWYFDHIVPSNRGTQENILFFLSRNYWKCFNRSKSINKKKEVNSQQNLNNEEYQREQLDQSVKKEMESVIQNQANATHVQGIRIHDLGMCYYRYPFGIKSKFDKVALENIYLEIQKNELVSLLGHNGAGKSTLIGVLTGILTPSQGIAIVGGYDISSHMSQIKMIMGVCPQFDILWNELTVYEHLEMYCKVKGVHQQKIKSEINKILTEILLIGKINCRIGTLSGGQKRRVSLGISIIGNPKIIFLDEPTTGMDPKTRREIWNMIKDMRQNRSVILTTHAMEEADILSDRIMILSDGKLKAIGTPLYLKNNHGDSYRLNLIIHDHLDTDVIRGQLKKILSSSKSITSESSSIIIGIQYKHIKELQHFLEIIESEDLMSLPEDLREIKSSIKEWSLSHSTMEEVFMKLSNNCSQFRRNQEVSI